MTDPATLMGQLDADARALDAVGRELGAKLKELAEVEIAHQDAYDAALLEVNESSKEKREAKARLAVPVELRGRLARLRREVEALKSYARIKGDTMSGRQSQLSALRDEARVG